MRKLLLLLCLFLTACESTRTAPGPSAVYTPPTIQEDQPIQRNPGSLFDERQASFLFDDNRAKRIGDIVMVEIVEESTALSKADTETDRESGVELGVSSFFNQTRLPIAGKVVGETPAMESSAITTFTGEGETTRESYISATIAARVVRVLPNGLLEIEGGRHTRINEETQVVVIRGLVRSNDVSGTNTIRSTQLADAQIEYFGKGVIGDKQRPGWVTRILENIWPF